jgi:4-amino-4-deoxy-L-arabinose transferase-like glycosyltransferase
MLARMSRLHLHPAVASPPTGTPPALAPPPGESRTGAPTTQRGPRLGSLLRRVPRPELLALVVLAGLLNLWALSRNLWANEYYSAAVRSMSESWHNFLFASFDPAGVMTVDKPPLALWVQTLSVKLFGFHSLSILVPQALMGIASVTLVYDLTRRRFGRAAGFVAGLVLATTPITVAISRHNNPDALLILCCTAALWCLVRALEDDRTRWLVLCGVCVGLGFETKMGAALLVVPGIALAWLWVAPRGHRRALRQLLAGAAALLVVGGAWPLLVTLTPASERPWVSGTSDNSIVSLITNYNGLGRLDGQAGGPGALGGGGGAPGGGFSGRGAGRALGGATGAGPGAGGPGAGGAATAGSAGATGAAPGGTAAQGGFPGGGLPGGRAGGGRGAGASVFGAGASVFGEGTGALRLVNASLGGQAGWLLGFALIGGLAILCSSRLRRRDPRTGWLLALGGGFLTTAVAFSAAQGIFHPYYVSLLAPFTAALVGAGAAQLTGRGLLARIFTVLAIVGGVAGELLVLHNNPGELGWLEPLLIAGGVATAVILACLSARRVRIVGLTTILALLLIAPATWAVQTLGHATSGTFPAGGPESASAGGFGGGAPRFAGGGTPAGGGTSQPLFGTPSSGTTRTRNGFSAGGGANPGGVFGGSELTQAMSYVKSHGGGTIAVSSQSEAASLVISDGAKVAGIGGFSGRESDVSLTWFAGEVRTGHIRWVLTNGASNGPGGGGGEQQRPGATAVLDKVAQVCRSVNDGESTTGGAATTTTTNEAYSGGLYDCAGMASRL